MLVVRNKQKHRFDLKFVIWKTMLQGNFNVKLIHTAGKT